MLYQTYQNQSDLLSPLRLLAQHTGAALWLHKTERSLLRRVAAASEVFHRMKLTHTRPPYGIDDALVEGALVPVVEEETMVLPFGTLLHFKKTGVSGQPPVLLVAPLSGHFATLLRETARTLLQDHDVFITDWHNGRDVALRHGPFHLDDYVDYMMRFIERIGPGCHLVAVCQPCVAALAATALMAEDQHPATPRSLTLMAGPVDCRVNPTEVNRLAVSKPIDWFKHNLISQVPFPHAGIGRQVYPGFVQVSAFMAMNPQRHKQAFVDMFNHLVEGDVEQASVIQNFYEEYLAVNDLPAEFYLETVEKVFQTYDLARGELVVNGRRVDCGAIRHTALMTVEGERDDICAVGQTVAAHDLCTHVRPYLRTHHIQTGVGHYGVFSGRRWNQQIYPRVRDMIHASSG